MWNSNFSHLMCVKGPVAKTWVSVWNDAVCACIFWGSVSEWASTVKKNISNTYTNSVHVCVCVMQVVCAHAVRVLGGDHLHFHLLCLLEGPLQSQGWGHYGCEPLAAGHCLAISVLVLYSETLSKNPIKPELQNTNSHDRKHQVLHVRRSSFFIWK